MLKTKLLKKASVKKCLKSSKVRKILVRAGNARTNRRVKKKYKKIFTRKNTGRKKYEMKKYTVIIEFMNGRKNKLVYWVENEEKAKNLALRDWGYPTIYKSLTAVEAR